MTHLEAISEKAPFHRLGKIRLGIKEERPDGIHLEPTDYFVCPDEVKQVLGDKPRELQIMFPTEDKGQCAGVYWVRFSPSMHWLCRGNGKRAEVRVTDAGVLRPTSSEPGVRDAPCDPISCPYWQAGDCRKVMNLRFILPDCPGFGVYQINVGSVISIDEVSGTIDLMQGVLPRLSMIPLSLQLVEIDVHPGGWQRKVHVLNLTSKLSFTAIQKFAAETPPGRALLLAELDSEAPADIALPGTPETEPKSAETRRQEGSLADLWAKAKSKIESYEIQDDQLAGWFDRNYGLAVGPKDFKSKEPPSKFIAAMLSCFCDSVDQYFDLISMA